MSLTQLVQSRWKAVFAFLTTWVSTLYAFYQANPHMDVKQLVIAFILAVLSGTVVHQVPNKVADE